VTLSAQKLRGIVNLLADPLQAGAAANILAQEASRRGVLVADLIAQTAAPEASAQTRSRKRQDVEPVDDGGPYIKLLAGDMVGLVTEVVHETPRAWLVDLPSGAEAWLAKSQCSHHGEDQSGRAILILPHWLARKIGATS
jgi:hypothetical protein